MTSAGALRIRWLGRVGYAHGLAIQAAWAEASRNRGEDVVIFVEHDPVYTTGRHSAAGEEEERRLRGLGADYFHTPRGGKITFHGPGQLVGYPVIGLTQRKRGVRWYVGALETTLIESCAAFGVTACTTADTGVWVGNSKIAAIGVNVSRGTTTHGFALNCDVDLGWFSHIVPCGLVGKGVTSLSAATGKQVRVTDALPHVAAALGRHFAQHAAIEVPRANPHTRMTEQEVAAEMATAAG